MAEKILDRKTAPASGPLHNVLFPSFEMIPLGNGIPVYYLLTGEEEILELQMIFPAGKSFELSPGLASITGKMMGEGSAGNSGAEIARLLENEGAFINVGTGYESSTLSLTLLARNFPAVSPVLRDYTLYPDFPDDEWKKLLSRSLQNLQVEEQKTSYIARREFLRLLWGPNHPYGRTAGSEDIATLKVDDFRDFHGQYFDPLGMSIIAAGRFDITSVHAELNAAFGGLKPAREGREQVSPALSLARRTPDDPASGLHYFEKKDSMQATVRVGHRAFERDHKDYFGMQVVTTLFGGYFGSRLMKNIREDKGFTYGIGASWLSMKYSGNFIIQTDVGNQYIQQTLAEIDHELNKLMTQGCGEEELTVVKNYLTGRTISGRETPAQLANILSIYLAMELDFSRLNEKFDAIHSMTPAKVLELANQYYRPEALLKVVSGKMED